MRIACFLSRDDDKICGREVKIMFGSTLKRLRIQKGLSQENVAEKLHVVRQTISKWENGLSSPSMEQLNCLATVLDVSVGQLLGANDEIASDQSAVERRLFEIKLGARLARLKRTVIGAALLVCGTIGFSVQRIIDAIFTANNWNLHHSAFNPLLLLSLFVVAGGAILCVCSSKERY